MSKSSELIQQVEKYGAHNYHPLPLVLNRGQGSKVWDVDGKEYLDFLSCYSALNFGHQYPPLVEVMKAQLDKLAVCSRAFHSEPLCHFAKELAEFTGLDSVLTMNSGTEAVETALKLARKWGYAKKGVSPGRARIIGMENNFHGRSIAVVSFSTEALYREGFGPFVPGFETVPFGDLARLEEAIEKDPQNTVAVLLEPIQAEAGILIPPDGYLSGVKKLCAKSNVLFILDEIQTGLARVGKNFCFQYESATPDVLILGKSLGGGLIPASAVVARKDVMDVFRPGEHGSTFGGNPLASEVARKSVALLSDGQLAARASQIGDRVTKQLRTSRLPKVKELRHKGALLGIELEVKAGGARKYTERLATLGVLCKETHDHVIRIAPPLIISDAELDRGVAKVIEVIEYFG